MKYVGFDLELMSSFPDGVDHDTLFFGDLRVSAAALSFDGMASVFCKQDYVGINESTVEKIVDMMDRFKKAGHMITTWNGAAFDFRVLAHVAPSLKDRLAAHMLDHVDLMMIVIATRGHLLSLQAAAIGAGLSKMTHVKLKSGAVVKIDGHLAVDLWNRGEIAAVIDYLTHNCEVTSRLAKHIHKVQAIRWLSKSHRDMTIELPAYEHDRLPTVGELRNDKRRHKVNTSWMTDPPDFDKMIEWATGKKAKQSKLL